jgi:phenylalanyl-tRNA synthetase beta chain
MDTTTLIFLKKLNATVSKSPRNEDYKIQNVIASQLNSQGFNDGKLINIGYVALSGFKSS